MDNPLTFEFLFQECAVCLCLKLVMNYDPIAIFKIVLVELAMDFTNGSLLPFP